MKRKLFLPLLLLTFSLSADPSNEPFSFVGMRLPELFERFGLPQEVFAVRGNEIWQDDIVFRYPAGDFFIYRDRVWQVRVSSVRGISTGDPKQAVLLVWGSNIEDRGNHLLAPLPGGVWPLMLRFNISNAGLVSDIFIYRPDY